jgi:hypothetical protein
MAKNYIKISSLSNGDISAMFDEICKVMKTSRIDVISKMTGVSASVAKVHKVTLRDLCELISSSKMGVELKVTYEMEMKDTPPEEVLNEEPVEEKDMRDVILNRKEPSLEKPKEDDLPDF